MKVIKKLEIEKKLIKFGTSNGVIIPSEVLKELDAEPGDILILEISKKSNPRKGWDKEFEKYAREVEITDQAKL